MVKKIEEAYNRNFKNVFVCMRCNATIKANPKKVESKEVFCRKCGGNQLRPKNAEKRAVSTTAAAPVVGAPVASVVGGATKAKKK
ncbi:MAG: hypothetical protein CVU81_01340 [Euryarchaeota archaeon HGW-Euryarchaeota-1]|nr:MAG: hypothetical protein CVU81_01340 [Euryarchaeota archaeon HGW-Euryarchaeota-1]